MEVKKKKEKTDQREAEAFLEVVSWFRRQNPERRVSAGFLSLGGFTRTASALLREQGVGTATVLNHVRTEWS